MPRSHCCVSRAPPVRINTKAKKFEGLWILIDNDTKAIRDMFKEAGAIDPHTPKMILIQPHVVAFLLGSKRGQTFWTQVTGLSSAPPPPVPVGNGKRVKRPKVAKADTPPKPPKPPKQSKARKTAKPSQSPSSPAMLDDNPLFKPARGLSGAGRRAARQRRNRRMMSSSEEDDDASRDEDYEYDDDVDDDDDDNGDDEEAGASPAEAHDNATMVSPTSSPSRIQTRAAKRRHHQTKTAPQPNYLGLRDDIECDEEEGYEEEEVETGHVICKCRSCRLSPPQTQMLSISLFQRLYPSSLSFGSSSFGFERLQSDAHVMPAMPVSAGTGGMFFLPIQQDQSTPSLHSLQQMSMQQHSLQQMSMQQHSMQQMSLQQHSTPSLPMQEVRVPSMPDAASYPMSIPMHSHVSMSIPGPGAYSTLY